MCGTITSVAYIFVLSLSFAIWEPPISEKDLSFEEIDAKISWIAKVIFVYMAILVYFILDD